MSFIAEEAQLEALKKKLGINPEQLEVLKDKHTKENLGKNAKYITKQLIRELQEIELLKEVSAKETNDLAQEFGLALDTTDKQEFSKYSNEFKVVKKFADDPVLDREVDHSYAGREIEVHIQALGSNNDLNPTHVQDTFDGIFNAAESLNIKNKKYLQTIHEIKEEFETGTVHTRIKVKGKTLEFNDNLANIKNALSQQMHDNSLIIPVLDRNINFHKQFIGRLAIALWQAENNSNDVPDYTTYAKYIKMIQNKDLEDISKVKRPFISYIYKAKVPSDKANESTYILTEYIPTSDVSSGLRTLESKNGQPQKFSNEWTVRIKHVKITHKRDNTIEYKVVKKDEYIRSSSIAIINYEPKNKKQYDRNTELEDVYKSFKNHVKQLARDKIVEMVNNNNKKSLNRILGSDRIVINEAFVTLLSPLMSVNSGLNLTKMLGKPVANIAIHENEYAQLQSTKYCLDRIRKEILTFNDTDINDILKRTEQSRKDQNNFINKHIKDDTEFKSKLRKIKIYHRNYFSNYMVNKVGKFSLEVFGVFNLNKKYFLEGNKQRLNYIRRYVKYSKTMAQHPELQQELLDILTSKSTRKNAALKKFQQKYGKEFQDCKNVSKIINLYMDIEDHFYNTSSKRLYRHGKTLINKNGKSDRALESYIASIKEIQLLKRLNIVGHVTCKSGVDRTGLQSSCCEVMSLQDPNKDLDMQAFSENILRSVEHGAARRVKTANIHGAAGQQITANVFSTIKRLHDFIKTKALGKVGSLGRTIYRSDEKTYEQVLESMGHQKYTNKDKSLFFGKPHRKNRNKAPKQNNSKSKTYPKRPRP